MEEEPVLFSVLQHDCKARKCLWVTKPFTSGTSMFHLGWCPVFLMYMLCPMVVFDLTINSSPWTNTLPSSSRCPKSSITDWWKPGLGTASTRLGEWPWQKHHMFVQMNISFFKAICVLLNLFFIVIPPLLVLVLSLGLRRPGPEQG